MPTGDPETWLSGSIGDTVHARNAHGQYTRPRTTPTDPNTLRMQRYRSRWATIAGMWAATLTPLQRRDWNEYGRQWCTIHKSGLPQQLTGQQHFMRCNQSRHVAPLGWILDPPTTHHRPIWTMTRANGLAGPSTITITFDNTDTWANDNTGALIVFCGKPQSTATNFFAGPFRRVAIIRGSTTTPPTSPVTKIDGWAGSPGLRRWHRSYVILGDGRVSESHILPFEFQP